MAEALDSYDKWLARGKTLGLDGATLRQYVEEKVKADEEREERLEARRQKILEQELIEKERKREHDLKMADEEEKQRILMQEEEEKKRVHEIELAKIHYETQRLKDCSETKTIPVVPHLPSFEEEKDDIDAYIKRFEMYAAQCKWRESNYAMYLSSLLRGKALEVYSRMAVTDMNDYVKLKSALLRHYHMTEEGFRKKFHGVRMDKSETAHQFMAKLGDYFDRWLELAEIGDTYEELRDFIVKEQFLHACPKEVSVHIREKELKTPETVVHAAEVFMDAHKINFNSQGKKTTETKTADGRAGFNTKKSEEGSSKKKESEKTCWLCKQKGHIAFNCRAKQKAIAAVLIEENDDLTDIQTTSTALVVQDIHQCHPNIKKKQKCARIPTIGQNEVLIEDRKVLKYLPTSKGFVNNKEVTILRDTGCSGAVIKKDLVDGKQFTGKTCQYISVDKTIRSAPVAEVYVQSSVYTGMLKALCMEDPLCDVIIGNLPQVVKQPTDILYLGSRDNAKCTRAHRSCQKDTDPKGASLNRGVGSSSSGDINTKATMTNRNKVNISQNKGPVVSQAHKVVDGKHEIVQAVVTRQQATQAKIKQIKPLKVPGLDVIVSYEEFKEEQGKDPTLHQARKWAEISKKKQGDNKDVVISFKVKKGLLYRCISTKKGVQVKQDQLVVPKRYRCSVMKLGHESIMAGHMGITKTLDRIQSNFYWPCMYDDVSRFCKSCDDCQKTIPKGRVPKAPLDKMPVISTPFQRVAIDLIGPLMPVSSKGNRYILTMVDMATRYPKASAIPRIDTVTVAEELVKMFSDIGIPNEILSDNGSQFTSDMMAEVHRLLSIKSITTTPYHAQCNGLCERYNGTLKQMLRRMISEQEKEWDRFIEPLLFAYREVPVESLGGFSPFELIYGRTVRGPMSVLRDIWSNEELNEEMMNTYEYVLNLRSKLEETCKIATESLLNAQEKQKYYFDKKSKPRILEAGDEVLLLLPSENNKLQMKWKGPFKIKQQVGMYNYVVEIGNNEKVFHINMLKKYYRRDDQTKQKMTVSAIVWESDHEEDVEEESRAEVIELCSRNKIETWKDVNVNPELSENQKEEVHDLLQEFSDILSSVPGTTNLIEHKIELTDNTPIRSKMYPVPYGMYETMREEINSMLSMDIIEPSESPYSSPVVLVKKKDGGLRHCQDMRQVNKVTRFNCESLPDPNSIYAKLTGDVFFSKLDFCKGYWQIPMAEDAKEITAFSTPFGHYQFKKMPFGLVNSGATYMKMMRLLLKDLECTDCFVDDVLQHTKDWSQQIDILRKLFERIRAANLTIKPSKCFIAYNDVDFLGHRIKEGEIMPMDSLTEKIHTAGVPKTKKQLRSFLGLANYYRKFIPGYAGKVKALTDLTKTGCPDKLKWEDQHQHAFDMLKEQLSKKPILKLADLSRPFVLRTDASEIGVGAVLLQDYGGMLFPVAYISKKLLPRECSYSVMEKECLAVVWAVNKLRMYLYGKEFILQTDHQSLTYLDKAKFTNQRVMRWSLALQPYRYRVEYIKGEDNLGADMLSRQV